MTELPQLSNSAYTLNYVTPRRDVSAEWKWSPAYYESPTRAEGAPDLTGDLMKKVQGYQRDLTHTRKPKKENAVAEKKIIFRIVNVYIIDPDTRLALSKRIVFKTDAPLETDDSDEELFYRFPVLEALAKHNESRVCELDKKASAAAGRDVVLEPIRIKDLRMVTVDLVRVEE